MAASARRPSRTVNLTGSVMRIRVGKEETRYHLTPIPTDWGKGFTCRKIGGTRKTDNDGAEYALVVDPIEGQHFCGCTGFEKSGSCRHVEALLALLSRGKI